MKGYTTREVAEVLGLPTSKILGWTRSGLLTPERGDRGAYLFSFQDIVLLRTARELLDADIPARKVRESLEALREQLPTGRPLSAVHVSAVGDRVLVQDDDAVWEPDSGQLQIDFSVSDLALRAEPVARRALADRGSDDELSADEWYDTAIDLEAVAVDRAVHAYEQAIRLDSTHADAYLNLGRLHHEAGRIGEAEGLYRAATQADPENARGFFNLGVALEDRGAPGPAASAYREAIRLRSDLAVAHFNLCRLLEADGKQAEALSHLAEYRRLVRQGDSED